MLALSEPMLSPEPHRGWLISNVYVESAAFKPFRSVCWANATLNVSERFRDPILIGLAP